MEEKQSYTTAKIIGTVVAVLFVLIFLRPFKIVNSDERGLKFNFGAIQETVLEPGLHWRLPIYQKIRVVSIKPIQLDQDIVVGSSGAITKDNQTVGSDMTIFYKFKPDQLVAMYRQYGEEKIGSIIAQTITESFKSEIGKYDIFSLPMKQDEIRNKVYEAVTSKLAGYPVDVTELKIVNYDWSDQFDAQIQETMSRAQQVKQKEQELLISQNEQQKKVKEADAEKQATIVRAEGAKEAARLGAEAKALEGDGIRKYNESVAKNWDIELAKVRLEIEKIKAEKWNGVYVPNNMYGPIPVDTQGGVKK